MKKILLSAFLLAAFLTASTTAVLAETNCKIKLMSTKKEKLGAKLLNTTEKNNFFDYTIRYNNVWQKIDYDNNGFFDFKSPKTPDFAGLNINPFAPKMGGGIDPHPLKTTTVIINGKKAIWKQWRNDYPEQQLCQEGGKIQFKSPPADGWEKDNAIYYNSGNKKELRTMKAMIYSIKFN